MASKQQGSTEFSKKNKTENKKRAWTSDEEEVLLASLKGLVAAGWKSDNGFRAGYVNHLEETMRKAFPHANIKGRPHIDSKLTAWKRTYSTLTDILNRSGVGFNLKGDNKIDCDNVLWDEICKPDSSIKNWRAKSWPFLEGWKVVFGKDRACGDGAAEFMEMVNDLMQDDEVPSTKQQKKGNCTINLDDEIPPSAAEDSVGQSTYENAKPSKNQPTKRKFEESISSLVDLVGDIHKTNAAKYEVFRSTIGKQAAVKNSRGDLWPLIQNIPGLTLDEMFDVGEKLLKMPECLELFLGLSVEARPAYVDRIINLGN